MSAKRGQITADEFKLIFAFCDPAPTAIPEGWEVCGMYDTKTVSWFGRALPYEIIRSGCVHIGVGLGIDHWVKVDVGDFDVFGFSFIKEIA